MRPLPLNADICPIQWAHASAASITLPHFPSQHAGVPNLRRYIVSFLETTSFQLYHCILSRIALMFVLEEPQSKKRRRSSTECEDLEPQPIAKKPKSTSASRSQYHRRPPSFWTTLSKIWLTRTALKEFDRRDTQEAGQQCCAPTPNNKFPPGRACPRLKRFARRGGPDLSHLRAVRLHIWRS